MNAVKRALVAITMVALTLGVASMPPLSPAANAAPADPAACAAANAAVATATADVSAAKKAKKKATKKARKAKKVHARKHLASTKAKVKQAKKKLQARKAGLLQKKQALATASAQRPAACAGATGVVTNQTAFDFGSLLGLLTQSGGTAAGLTSLTGGTNGLPFDLTQLRGLLSLTSGSDLPLDASTLTDILAGFGSFDPTSFDPAALTDLLAGLSGGFDPSIFIDLLSGGLDPAIFLELFETGLAALTGGLDLPIPTDPAAFLDLFQTGLAALTGQLDAGQLGELLGLLTMAGGFGGTDLDLAQLTSLLTSLFGGVLPTEYFTPGVLADLLTGFNDLPIDPATVMALFGGMFSPDQLTELLSGAAGTELLGTAFGTLLAQLAGFTGGTFAIPEFSPEILAGLVTTLLALVDDVLGALLDGLGIPGLPAIPGLCIIPLPLLCG